MEDNELYDDEVVETEAEVMDENDEEEVSGGIGSAAAIFGLGAVLGIVVDRFVAPVVGNALNSARDGLVHLLTKGKEYTEVEQKEENSEEPKK